MKKLCYAIITTKHGFLIHLHLLDLSGSGFNTTLGVQQMFINRKTCLIPILSSDIPCIKLEFANSCRVLVARETKLERLQLLTEKICQKHWLDLEIIWHKWSLDGLWGWVEGEYCHVAYQVKGNDARINMVANMLPVDTPLTPG